MYLKLLAHRRDAEVAETALRNTESGRNSVPARSKRIFAEQANRLIVGNYGGVSGEVILKFGSKKVRHSRGIISIPNGHRYSVIFLEILDLIRPILVSGNDSPTDPQFEWAAAVCASVRRVRHHFAVVTEVDETIL